MKQRTKDRLVAIVMTALVIVLGVLLTASFQTASANATTTTSGPPGYFCLFHDGDFGDPAICGSVDALDENEYWHNFDNFHYANGNSINDTISSLYIGSPWGTRTVCRMFVWKDANEQGPHHYYTYNLSGDWDYFYLSSVALFNPKQDKHLGDSNYDDGSPMGDSISSMSVRCTQNP